MCGHPLRCQPSTQNPASQGRTAIIRVTATLDVACPTARHPTYRPAYPPTSPSTLASCTQELIRLGVGTSVLTYYSSLGNTQHLPWALAGQHAQSACSRVAAPAPGGVTKGPRDRSTPTAGKKVRAITPPAHSTQAHTELGFSHLRKCMATHRRSLQ